MTPERDLIATLYLYIGRYEETQLTTEQKELLYNCVEEWRSINTSDYCEPMERWWR